MPDLKAMPLALALTLYLIVLTITAYVIEHKFQTLSLANR